MPAANAHDLAVRHDQLKTRHVVGSHAVRKGMRPAGIFRNVAADGARFLTRRVGSIVQTMLLHSAREIQIDDAGLDHGPLIFRVDFQNVIHAREGHDNSAAPG